MYFLKRTFGLLAVVMLLAASPKNANAQIFDDAIYTFVLFDQLEYAPGPSERPVGLEAASWIGGDLNRLWLRAEGEQSTLESEGEAELEAFYGRLITPYFDALAGARLDTRWGEERATRGLLAVGVEGVAPYMFEVAPTLYVSQDGDVSAEFEAAYHFLFTQRLVLEPEMELTAAVQDVPEWGVGTGVNDLSLGLRLRYEIRRKFAPYVGYEWGRSFGQAADFARAEGAGASSGAFVFGLRLWR
jgi:copper resistance protein B